MMHTIHNVLWALLLLIHTAFLLRCRTLLARRTAPGKTDRLLMGASQLLLAPAILSTLTLITEVSFLHLLCSLMPLAMMFILARKSFRRRHPMLLPLINGLWIAAALLTGIQPTGGSL